MEEKTGRLDRFIFNNNTILELTLFIKVHEMERILFFFAGIDWISFTVSIVGIVISFVWPLILFFCLLKPVLRIECIEINEKSVKVKVVNKSHNRKAINLKTEICFLKCSEKTVHLKINKDDFIILPPNDFRIFKAETFGKSERKRKEKYQRLLADYKAGYYCLRVRVHANHEYSGFGKAFERKFHFSEK